MLNFQALHERLQLNYLCLAGEVWNDAREQSDGIVDSFEPVESIMDRIKRFILIRMH